MSWHGIYNQIVKTFLWFSRNEFQYSTFVYDIKEIQCDLTLPYRSNTLGQEKYCLFPVKKHTKKG